MSDDKFHPERPPNEAWWERELLRNQKLMDKYMEVLGDQPDWSKWRNPEDLYNKVHFGIDPPERPPEEELFDTEKLEPLEGTSTGETDEADPMADQLEADSNWEEEEIESDDDEFESDSDEEFDEFDGDPIDNEGYREVARLAREFAVRIMRLEDLPPNSEVFYLSAGKIGANLAGGHGLGYDDDMICGNIVKCRWALSDCEFCCEMLEHLARKTDREDLAELLRDCRRLAEIIDERIEKLRARVWW